MDTPDPADPPNTPPAPTRRGFGPAALLFVAALGTAAGAGGVLFSHGAGAGRPAAPDEAAAHPLFQCPMHPTIIQDHPGNCPICGMKLVQVESAAAGSASAGGAAAATAHAGHASAPTPAGLTHVDIDPARQQLIGLRLAEVVSGPVGGAWKTLGRVSIDETRVRRVSLKTAGFVDRVFVDYVGRKVRKGEPLFTLYSPELLSAQEEYLLALRTRETLAGASSGAAGPGESLVAAARRKLALWDVSAAELDRIARTGQPLKNLTFTSPLTGVVTRKDVVEGMRLEAGAMPYEIVDLSTVWVLADVYESELARVREDMTGALRLDAYPERQYLGKVAFIDPLMNAATRTVKIRLSFANPTGELRPEMFGEVTLLTPPHEALTIPADAVIDSGALQVVFLSTGDGRFEPRAVELGTTDGTNVEVRSGLVLGDEVVTRANFLVDSESRLRASLAALTTGRTARPPSGATTSIGPESARVLPATGEPAAPASAAGGHVEHGR